MPHRLGLSVAAAVALASMASAEVSRTIDETISLKVAGTLCIENYGGSIEVSTWDRPEVRVKATIVAQRGLDPEYARKTIERARIQIREKAHSVRVTSDFDDVPSTGWFGPSKKVPDIHYEITGPRDMHLRVEDYKSEIHVQDVAGSVTLESYKGEIELENVGEEVSIESYKGSASGRDVRGIRRLKTYKGEIEISDSSLFDNSDVDTYKGEITIRIPSDTAFDLDAKIGKRGAIHSDFPIKRRNGKKHIQKSYNGGGPRLDIETHKGRITIRHCR